MQKFFIRFLIISLFLFLGTVSVAQIRMTVQVDEKIISPDDFLHIQYTIENAKNVKKFVAPAFNGFKVVQGPDYTNGWTLINGEMKDYVAISFILQPVRKGKFVIQPAAANADGQNIRSGTVAIEVTDRGSGGYIQIDKDPGNQPLNDMILHAGESVQQKIKNNLFVRLEISKTSVYVGEPLVATYKLYTRLNSESRVTRRPSFSGSFSACSGTTCIRLSPSSVSSSGWRRRSFGSFTRTISLRCSRLSTDGTSVDGSS